MPYSTGFDPAPDSAQDSALDSAPDSFESYYAIYRLSLLKIHSYLTKASCFSLLLMGQLFLYLSSVGQKNGKYSNRLSELPFENKCSMPPGKFQNALVKIIFIFDKILMPRLTFGERGIFTLVTCLSKNWEI